MSGDRTQTAYLLGLPDLQTLRTSRLLWVYVWDKVYATKLKV
jgi:hypothetical protein